MSEHITTQLRVASDLADMMKYRAKYEEDYAKHNICQLVDDYVKDSYKGLVSSFLKEERISADELRELLAQVEEYEKSQSV